MYEIPVQGIFWLRLLKYPAGLFQESGAIFLDAAIRTVAVAAFFQSGTPTSSVAAMNAMVIDSKTPYA